MRAGALVGIQRGSTHGAAPADALYAPTKHGTHAPPPRSGVAPAAHTQRVPPSTLTLHASRPSQSRHAVAPLDGWYSPAPQASHSERASALAYVPGRHRSHAVAPLSAA
jgi:hypothetical protein